MAEQKKAETKKVGESIEVKEGAVVRRPNGNVVTVTGGVYVIDEVGDYVVDGEDIKAK